MRSLIKLVMAAAIYMGPVIAHQQTLTSRLANLNLKCDAVLDKYKEHIPHTAGPHPKALLGQMKAVNDQVSDLTQELGCGKVPFGQLKAVDDQVSDPVQELGGLLVWNVECISLVSKNIALEVGLFALEFEKFQSNRLEKKKAAAGAGTYFSEPLSTVLL